MDMDISLFHKHKHFIINEFIQNCNIDCNIDTGCIFNKFTIIFIDGIQVKVKIQKNTKQYYDMYIFSKNIYFQDEFEIDDLLHLYTKTGFNNIILLLNHIEYLKKTHVIYRNCFITRTEYKKLTKTKENNDTDNECSICYKSTDEYTLCKHPICYQCRENCLIHNKIKCPICRQTELYIYPIELYQKKTETKEKKQNRLIMNTDDYLLKMPLIHVNFLINEFIQLFKRTRTIIINKYSKIIIDGIEVTIEVFKYNENAYYLGIFSTNISHEIEISHSYDYCMNDTYFIRKQILFCKKGPFYNIIDLLNMMEHIQNTYKFVGIQLVSSTSNEIKKITKLNRQLSIHLDANCSVCSKNTNQIALCKHPICLHCRETSILQNKKCSICKKNISIYPSI